MRGAAAAPVVQHAMAVDSAHARVPSAEAMPPPPPPHVDAGEFLDELGLWQPPKQVNAVPAPPTPEQLLQTLINQPSVRQYASSTLLGGRYRIVQKIGTKGAYGQGWLAEDLSPPRDDMNIQPAVTTLCIQDKRPQTFLQHCISELEALSTADDGGEDGGGGGGGGGGWFEQRCLRPNIHMRRLV